MKKIQLERWSVSHGNAMMKFDSYHAIMITRKPA